jgi:hypothetical protein
MKMSYMYSGQIENSVMLPFSQVQINLNKNKENVLSHTYDLYIELNITFLL